MASSLFSADPYLWATAASIFAGLAAGQALRALLRLGEGELAALRRRPRRIARAICLVGLCILALAALLVLPGRVALASAFDPAGGSVVLPWSALVFFLALLGGLLPFAAGLPLAALSLAALVLLRLALDAWLPLRPGAPPTIASFLPYEVGTAYFRGQLELQERDSIPVAQELSLGSSSIALTAELLELGGPLGLCAELSLLPRRAEAAPARRFYRIVGLAAPGGLSQAFPPPPYLNILDYLLPLPAEEGTEPGGAAARRIELFGLARRSRTTSPAIPLVALDRVFFVLDGEGAVQAGLLDR
jgi:hypothetical protein